MSDTGILTTQQAAEIAGISTDTINRWCNSGKITAQKTGQNWEIDETSLRQYMKRKPKTASSFSLGASVRQDQVEENQRKMAQLEADVMSGKIKPLYIPSGVKSLR
jgi:excisionase family DNA binding protein